MAKALRIPRIIRKYGESTGYKLFYYLMVIRK
jgi:hypothetical protein